MQVEPSDPIKVSQEVTVLIEALPPVLIVHLNRFHYDTVAGGVVKNRKHVQFSAELEIPPGMFFSLPRGRELIVAQSPQISWYLRPDDPWFRRDTRSMEFSTANGVRNASGLGLERNGLPRRSARRHVLLVYFPFLFSFSSRCSYRLALDTIHASSRDRRHNIANARQLYAPFSSHFRLSFM